MREDEAYEGGLAGKMPTNNTYKVIINKNSKGYTYSVEVNTNNLSLTKEQVKDLVSYAEDLTNGLVQNKELKKMIGGN